MPILHLVDHENRTVFARIVGDIPTGDVIDNLCRLGASSQVPDHYNMLIDLRYSATVRSYAEGRSIIQAWSFATNKYAKKCVFLASEPTGFGAVRMTTTLAEIAGYDAHAAHSEEEACQLLGLSNLPTDEQFNQNGFEV